MKKENDGVMRAEIGLKFVEPPTQGILLESAMESIISEHENLKLERRTRIFNIIEKIIVEKIDYIPKMYFDREGVHAKCKGETVTVAWDVLENPKTVPKAVAAFTDRFMEVLINGK